MSADVLRAAAALMRERAEGSLRSPWIWTMDQDSGEQFVTTVNDREVCTVNEWSSGFQDGAHIASWHPVVALTVADWLDRAARDMQIAVDWATAYDEPVRDVTQDFEHALAAAHAYLGTTP